MMSTPTAGKRITVPVAMTTADAAQFLGWHPNSVTRAYRAGTFTGGRVGRTLWINGESVAAYLNERGIPAEVVSE